ncbi:MAG: hypothetical protein QOD14_2235 [Solirubrobacterales bacterium]|jgi:hypothetical protein|nr:hypothetical protein [Solirubrobacterales bacterium]
MTSEPMEATRVSAPNTWTCSRCDVTVSFAPDYENTGLPATWVESDGELYCLGCRRDMAGEAGLEGVDEDTPSQTRLQIRSHARIEFEIQRDPSREDNRIAKAVGTSTFAVRKARARLGMDPKSPA